MSDRRKSQRSKAFGITVYGGDIAVTNRHLTVSPKIIFGPSAF